MRIQLLWFDGCPNHETVHAELDRVLMEYGVESTVESLRVEDQETASAVKFPGSPTVRVDGVDIEPGFVDPGDYSLRCRVYATRRGLTGVPDASWIEDAVLKRQAPED